MFRIMSWNLPENQAKNLGPKKEIILLNLKLNNQKANGQCKGQISKDLEWINLV